MDFDQLIDVLNDDRALNTVSHVARISKRVLMIMQDRGLPVPAKCTRFTCNISIEFVYHFKGVFLIVSDFGGLNWRYSFQDGGWVDRRYDLPPTSDGEEIVNHFELVLEARGIGIRQKLV